MFGEDIDIGEGNNATRERKPQHPPFPTLSYPHYPEVGKGWCPLEHTSETLMLQASRDFVEAIKELKWYEVNRLLRSRIDLDYQNDAGEAPIHLAIAARHEALVRFLLDQAVDIDVTTDEGKTPLHYGCAHNDTRLVNILLYLQANVHRITNIDGENALHFAAYWGNIRIAKRLLRRGIDFTCKAKTWGTPLECARSQGHEEMVKLLEDCIKRQKKMLQEHMDQLRAEQLESYNQRQKTTATIPQWTWTGSCWVRLDSKSSSDIHAPGTLYFGGEQQSRKRRLRFADVRPENEDDVVIFDPALAEDDYGLNYSNCVSCKACNETQHVSQTYCKDCGYVLHDTCPECANGDLEFETNCGICGAKLWVLEDDEEDGDTHDPYFSTLVPLTGDEEYGDYSGYGNPPDEEDVEREEQQLFWDVPPENEEWGDWNKSSFWKDEKK